MAHRVERNVRLSPDTCFEPAYLALHKSGELLKRAQESVLALRECHVCPRACGVDRLADDASVCRTGRYAQVASYGAHHGEEDCLRGWNGSGTIFFGMCNLRCVFCQNDDISQGQRSRATQTEELAGLMLELQGRGCHNINFVTPEHVVPQVLEALAIAADGGLRLPIVYNTSAYDSLDSLALLDGVVDIYMPDIKLWSPDLAFRYLKARDYPVVARRALSEMHRQVGSLRFGNDGLALRGVLVRHLVMPGLGRETETILEFLAHDLAPDTYVNVMAQYRPAASVRDGHYVEIARRVTADEYTHAVSVARRLGLRLDERSSGALTVW